MDWRVQMAMTGDVLDRIVWLLLALAALAERAAGAPDARRRLVLAIIRSGETVARDAFTAPATDAANIESAPAPVALYGDTPEDAIALAMSLRALALIARALAAPHRRLASLMAGNDRDGNGQGSHPARYALGRRVADAVFPPAQRLDTS